MSRAYAPICREQRCKAPIPRGADFYCEKHATKLVDHLNEWISGIMDVAQAVYLGRTNHPERRLLEHHHAEGRDHLAVLHWASDWAEAAAVEELVIREFRHKAKLKNISPDADGRFSGAWNCVYVSWTWKASLVPPRRGATPVSGLCWRKRLWPDPSLPLRPELLMTRLSREEAGALVADWRRALSP